MQRQFISMKGHNGNFWTIDVDKKEMIITYGVIHSDPKESNKSFETEEKCQKEADKLIKKKLEGGYEEVLLRVPGAPIHLIHRVEEAQKNKIEELSIDVRKSAGLVKEITKITSLKKLTISYAIEIPAEIGQLQNLVEFEIDSSYELAMIPEEIGQCKKMRRLMIRDTGITQLPESIGQLIGLQKLYIWGNKNLHSIPPTYSELTALETFWIVFNRGSYGKEKTPAIILPDGLFSKMTGLEELNIHHNDMEKLPAGMESLKKCTELKASNNKLTEIPLMITEMESLERLEFNGNPIETIPPEIVNLKFLSDFSIPIEEIKNVPQEALKKGIIGIRNHFNPESSSKTKKKQAEAAPNDREEIVKAYADRLKQFERDAKDKMYDKGHLAGLEKLLHFLKGETDIQPDYITNDDEYYLRTLCQIFSPFKEWTFVDRRVLAYMTGDQWSLKKDDDGFHEAFYSWLGKQLLENDYPGHFGEVIRLLTGFGIKEELSLQHTLQEVCYIIHDSDDKSYPATSLDEFILSHVEQHLPKMMNIAKEYGHARSYLTQLLLKNHEDKLQTYIPQLTEVYKSDGMDHLRYSVVEKFCAHDPARYESLALEQLKITNCQGCTAEMARILKKQYGNKFHDLAKKTCLETLDFISKSLNKKSDYHFNWSEHVRYGDGSKKFVEYVTKTFGAEVRDDIFRYVKDTKSLSLENIATALKYYGQDAMDIAAEGFDMTISDNEIAGFFRKYFNTIAPFDFSAYYEKSWEIATSEFREVAQTACLALSRQPVAAIQPKAEELLASKEADERYAGIMVLGLIGSSATLKLLQPSLKNEKNEELRDQVINFIYRSPAAITINEAKDRIANAAARGKLGKPAAKWLDEKALPGLTWSDGKPLDLDAIRFLFYRQSRLKDIGPDNEARDIYPLIDRSKSAPFAEALLKLIIKNGGLKAPNRFALSVAALLGGASVVPLLMKTAIDDKNENACAALGWQRSLEAAFALEKIMVHYKTKYPNVKNAASEAFELIAGQQQLTVSELKDKIIPDFGFVNRQWQFKCGKDQVVITIDKNVKLIIEDPQGKKLSTLPKSAPEAAKKEYKETSAAIREAAKQLTINLENYLCTQRKWTSNDWKAFFLQHPLAFALAQNFVWAGFDKRAMKETFLLKDDGNFTGPDGKVVTLNEKLTIGLVHPIDLSPAQITQWQQVLAKEKIDPPFRQLDRKTFQVPEELKGKTFSFAYEDKEQDASTFKYRAEKRGWQRGSVVDSGAVSAFRKRYVDEQLEVFIITENLGVQSYADGGTASFGRMFFVKLGSVVIGSYTYDEPSSETDPRLIPFTALPPIVYSETINDLEILLAKKKED
ncbi:DUF4132 domain-containing protein [Paraflavitalea sp. CAU 1676]|uniref:DUF4132 domain-containing protein n=1 Tax=Paraflavitalea sp. CAU 1676 TaxID=3032598 RepID=UPI0023D9CD48|nr:DUF4132 domain-containing protein [Paraflavitalea sp. CAU 1676]MDF2188616.1 DUF4132 domain-containing protein [Paraflavitalea sp. CAU 1676]